MKIRYENHLPTQFRTLAEMVPLGLTFHSQLNESVGPVLDRLQHLDPTRDKALFERIQSFGFEHPPADPHVAMQERVMDRATKIVAAQVSETKAPAIELGSSPHVIIAFV